MAEPTYRTDCVPLPAASEVEYVVIVAGGLEEVAKPAMAAQLGLPLSAFHQVCVPLPSANWSSASDTSAPGHVFTGEAGHGKIHFRLPLPDDAAGWARQRAEIASLPMVAGLLAPLGFASGLLLTNEGLAQAKEVMATSGRWDAAVRTWRYCRAAPPEVDAERDAREMTSLSFRASAVRDGTHSFKSTGALPAIDATEWPELGAAVLLPARAQRHRLLGACAARTSGHRRRRGGLRLFAIRALYWLTLPSGVLPIAELAQAIGAAVYKTRGLRVSLTGFDFEAGAILLQGELLLGINLWGGHNHGKANMMAKLSPEPKPLLP